MPPTMRPNAAPCSQTRNARPLVGLARSGGHLRATPRPVDESCDAQYNPLSTRSTWFEHVNSMQEPAASGPRDCIVLRGHHGDAGGEHFGCAV